MKFTVLMPVHNGIDYILLKKAINSVLQNKLIPNEFIIIVDGLISKQKELFLLQKKKNNSFIRVFFRKKMGISRTLNYGLKISKYNIIARADADDVNYKYRFLKQINFFKKHNLDILGSNIEETINGKRFVKKMPPKPNLFNFFLMNPINHMSVMFKKDRIIKLGGYPEIKYKEDYSLWFLAKICGYNIANLQFSLVKSRVDLMTLKRRKNFDAIISEFKMQFLILKKKFYFVFFSSFVIVLRVFFLMLPNFLYIFFIKRINRRKII
jgi:amylovoran biosynthesis glycosyltransferase AmsE